MWLRRRDVCDGKALGSNMHRVDINLHGIFTPLGHNEHLLKKTGFTVLQVRDVTDAVVSVSRRWQDARAKRRERLTAIEGDEGFEGLQRFLSAVYVLASERRLSRYMYLAEK